MLSTYSIQTLKPFKHLNFSVELTISLQQYMCMCFLICFSTWSDLTKLREVFLCFNSGSSISSVGTSQAPAVNFSVLLEGKPVESERKVGALKNQEMQ